MHSVKRSPSVPAFTLFQHLTTALSLKTASKVSSTFEVVTTGIWGEKEEEREEERRRNELATVVRLRAAKRVGAMGVTMGGNEVGEEEISGKYTGVVILGRENVGGKEISVSVKVRRMGWMGRSVHGAADSIVTCEWYSATNGWGRGDPGKPGRCTSLYLTSMGNLTWASGRCALGTRPFASGCSSGSVE